MPIIHDCDQYDAKYDELRSGIPTSSCFDKIVTPTGKSSTQWKGYAHHLIAERLLRRQVNTFTSEWMERGLELEADAVSMYEMLNDCEATKVGFVTTDDGLIGCSPDRLIGDKGLLEIKVPKPATQIGYLLTGEVSKDYYPQLQGQLFVTGREWVDIFSYHPELPPSCIRVGRDESFIGFLEKQLWDFNCYIKEAMAKIESLTGKKFTPTAELEAIKY